MEIFDGLWLKTLQVTSPCESNRLQYSSSKSFLASNADISTISEENRYFSQFENIFCQRKSFIMSVQLLTLYKMTFDTKESPGNDPKTRFLEELFHRSEFKMATQKKTQQKCYWKMIYFG